MNKNDSYQKLASQMIEMWQHNMATMMSDTDLVRMLLDTLQHNPFTPHDFETTTKETGRAFTDAHDGTGAVARLERRIAALEKRTQQLEADAAAYAVSKPRAANAKGTVRKAVKRAPASRSSRGRVQKKNR